MSYTHYEDKKARETTLTYPWFDAQEENELLCELSTLKWPSHPTAGGSTLERVANQHSLDNHVTQK